MRAVQPHGEAVVVGQLQTMLAGKRIQQARRDGGKCIAFGAHQPNQCPAEFRQRFPCGVECFGHGIRQGNRHLFQNGGVFCIQPVGVGHGTRGQRIRAGRCKKMPGHRILWMQGKNVAPVFCNRGSVCTGIVGSHSHHVQDQGIVAYAVCQRRRQHFAALHG